MKRFSFKVILLAAFLCLLFAVSANAESLAGTTFKVKTETELSDALNKINTEAVALYTADTSALMGKVNIEIENDITVTKILQVREGANVHIYGTAGKTVKLKEGIVNPTVSMLDTDGGSVVEFTNLIVDGQQGGNGFAKMIGKLILGEGVVIENFKVTSFLYPLIWAQDGNVFVGSKRIRYAPDLEINGAIIRNNLKGSSGMPLIFVISPGMDGGKLTVKNARFENNDTATYGMVTGGAIHASDITAIIEDTEFINNKGGGGGAIYMNQTDLTMKNTLFKGNEARQYEREGEIQGEGGGALHLQTKSTATIIGCTFEDNSSELSGGAVQAYIDTKVTFENCTFTNNEAATHGGAICVADRFDKDDSKPSKVTLNNCTLTGNKANGNDAGDNFASSPEAAGGGAIFLHEYCEAHLNAGTKLSKNESADEGGAVYVSFGAHLYMDGAQMEENKAATHGGAVYLDGTDAYRGYSHADDGNVPGDDDGYDGGGKFFMTDGLIYRNTAGKNGGGVYIGGENEVEVDGQILRFVGGEMQMTGGVITENQAMDMGGGIFVGSSGNDDIGGTFVMTGGTVHENIAGQDGNTSTGKDDAGAEIFSVGHTSYISVVEADKITSYIRNRSNRFVPESHRSLYYEDWYDDYSDQDPDYGKAVTKVGTGVNTGRYKSSIEPDRIVYTVPHDPDNAYNALILGYKLPGNDGGESPAIPETGDRSMLSLYAALLLVSASAYILMRKRGK